MISKIAKSAFNIALRSKAVTQAFNNTRAISAFNFSSVEKITKAQSRLLKAVERESKYEEENYEVDASVKEFLEEHNLTLKESDNSVFVELHKDNGDSKVQILF